MVAADSERGERAAGLAAGRFPARLATWLKAPPDALASGLDALTVLAIRCAGAAMGYVLQVAFARLLGASDYGVFALVWIWILVLGHICPMGLSQVVCRHVPVYHVRGQEALLRGFLFAGPLVVLALALATATAAAGLLWLAGPHLGEAQRLAFLVGMAIVPLIALQDFAENVSRAFNWPMLAVAPPFVLRPALMLLAFAVLVWTTGEASALTAVSTTLVAVLAGVVIHAGLVIHRVRSVVRPGPREPRLKEWLGTALPLAFVDGTHLIFSNADVLILGLFVDPATVAIYFAASRILQLVAFGQYAATAATAQRFSALAASGDVTRLAGLVRHTTQFNVVVAAATALGVWWAAPFLLGMFGAGFEAAAGVLTILVFGLIIQAAAGPGEDLLIMLGQQRACATVFAISLVLNICLNVALIPAYGIMGAAVAVTIAVVARSLALSWLVKSRLGMSIILSVPLPGSARRHRLSRSPE